MSIVAIDRNLVIFSEVIFKVATWHLYFIFWFPDSNFSLALIINSEFQ